MKRELFWFGIVGLTAMAVHLGSVALLLVPVGVPPLLANVFGFLLAFQVSHAGHRRLTFRHGEVPPAQSRGRFFVVALGSFALNEAMYAALLRYTALDYRVALAIVLFAVAVVTYLAARQWAFADRELA